MWDNGGFDIYGYSIGPDYEEYTYQKLCDAVSALATLGLIDEPIKTAFVEVDHELFERMRRNGFLVKEEL